jgi:inosose dehydratase
MFEHNQVRLGIAPTGWANDDMPLLGGHTAFEQIVSEMSLAGFAGCGVGNKFPKDPGVLLEALKVRNLEVSGVWFGTYFAANDMRDQTIDSFKETLAFLKAVGASRVILAELTSAVHQLPVAVLPNKPVFSDAQWKAMAQGLELIGKMARDEGMEISYHPHVGTGVENGADIDRLANATDAVSVPFCYDSGHLFYAGEDPLKIAEAYAGRINHVHLKDIRKDVYENCVRRGQSFLGSILDGVFTVPGNGTIDFKPIFRALADANYTGWLIVEAEQDPDVAIPLVQAQIARQYLKDTLGV